jgi:glycosyltransferase involved in cell wall biosynthesis
MKEGYITKEKRKKILLLTDDIRVHSGVAQIGREIVMNTAHKYNWVQIAGAIKHPDKGNIQDLSDDCNKKMNLTDSRILLYPCDGYGDEKLVRMVIEREKPDAILLITDPRYFEWLFQIEDEIRTNIPITYLNIWDDLPAPMYNQEFYDSCDSLFGISKQTKNINEMVLGDKVIGKTIKYIPHGLDNEYFKPLKSNDPELIKFKKELNSKGDIKFSLLFNSRNIRRKCIPDTIVAWKLFLDTLSKKERKQCQLVLHTQPVDQHGTDLPAVIKFLFPDNDHNIVMSTNKLSIDQMNVLYNHADGVILLSSAEGWGLSLTEAMLTGTPFIANVTGGMQDQMRFVDDKNNWYTPTPDIPSNHRGTYKECGEWALPIFPSNISLVGSPKTPYIFDDKCSSEDAAIQIKKLYNMSNKERKERGRKGMEWALGDEAGFTSKHQANRFIDGMEDTFANFTPRKSFTFTSDSEKSNKVLNHKLIY